MPSGDRMSAWYSKQERTEAHVVESWRESANCSVVVMESSTRSLQCLKQKSRSQSGMKWRLRAEPVALPQSYGESLALYKLTEQATKSGAQKCKPTVVSSASQAGTAPRNASE